MATKKQFKTATDLKKEMMSVASQVMVAFMSDLIEDFEKVDELSGRKRDGWFYWAVRDCGTHTRSTSADFDECCKSWGEAIKIKALIGFIASTGTFEILYTKK